MKKIKTCKIDIGPNEFSPQKGKFRVNMFVDLDVVDAIRKIASKRNMPYQTLINQKLRELFMNEQTVYTSVSTISNYLRNSVIGLNARGLQKLIFLKNSEG